MDKARKTYRIEQDAQDVIDAFLAKGAANENAAVNAIIRQHPKIDKLVEKCREIEQSKDVKINALQQEVYEKQGRISELEAQLTEIRTAFKVIGTLFAPLPKPDFEKILTAKPWQ